MRLTIRPNTPAPEEPSVELWLEAYADGDVALRCRKGGLSWVIARIGEGGIYRIPALAPDLGFAHDAHGAIADSRL